MVVGELVLVKNKALGKVKGKALERDRVL